MGPLDLIRHPLIFTGITVPEFIRWYIFDQPSKILRKYLEYLRACIEIFSFVFLVRTLFSPWRQIADPYQKRGFNLNYFLQTLTMNTVSRTIGFLFRSVTLFIGLGFVVALTFGFALFYLAWLAFPVLFWMGASYLIAGFL